MPCVPRGQCLHAGGPATQGQAPLTNAVSPVPGKSVDMPTPADATLYLSM